MVLMVVLFSFSFSKFVFIYESIISLEARFPLVGAICTDKMCLGEFICIFVLTRVLHLNQFVNAFSEESACVDNKFMANLIYGLDVLY